MADLSAPLLSGRRDAEVIVDVDDGVEGNGTVDGVPPATENPYDFLGVSAPTEPRPECTVDPFRNHTPSFGGVYEWLKMAVMVPFVLVRLVLFGLGLLVGFLATKLALLGWKDKQNPMPRWRCSIMGITRICTRCILFSFGYHWIKRIGRPAPRAIAPIVVSNHISYVEPIFFFYELFPTIVASESHDALPFVGTIIRAMQVIYVDRFSAPSRKHAVSEIKRKASCNGFPRLLLFPEGTTTNGRSLISFQLGAFIPGFPVQPVVVRYPYVHFDQSWGKISLAKLMLRMFMQFHNFMEVEYLPIIVPHESKQENAVHFSDRTSFAMASALNVVRTSHSYGDLMLLTRASEFNKKQCSKYMVEMAWIESGLLNVCYAYWTKNNSSKWQRAERKRKAFGISTSEAMEYLDRFFAMNPDSNGCVQLHGFLTSYGLGGSPLTEKIFGFIDLEKKGSITFQQFLLSSAYIRRQPSFWSTCYTIFNRFSNNGTGYISLKQLSDMIKSVLPGTDEEMVIHLMDRDSDGAVSKDDFMTFLQKNPLLIPLFCTSTKINGPVQSADRGI